MLWQRLQREMPATLAETISIADSYALGDPTQPLLTPVEPRRRHPIGDADRSYRRNDRPDYRPKRRDDRPDYQYGSNQVAAVDQDQPDAGNSQRQKNIGPAWGGNPGGKEAVWRWEEVLGGQTEIHFRDDAGWTLQLPHSESQQAG